jgi:hypothetical protein
MFQNVVSSNYRDFRPLDDALRQEALWEAQRSLQLTNDLGFRFGRLRQSI